MRAALDRLTPWALLAASLALGAACAGSDSGSRAHVLQSRRTQLDLSHSDGYVADAWAEDVVAGDGRGGDILTGDATPRDGWARGDGASDPDPDSAPATDISVDADWDDDDASDDTGWASDASGGDDTSGGPDGAGPSDTYADPSDTYADPSDTYAGPSDTYAGPGDTYDTFGLPGDSSGGDGAVAADTLADTASAADTAAAEDTATATDTAGQNVPPGMAVEWCRLIHPAVVQYGAGSTADVFAHVSVPGQTDITDVLPDPAPWLLGQVGWGPSGAIPSHDPSLFTWVDAVPDPSPPSDLFWRYDRYVTHLAIDTPGYWDYVARFSADAGATWRYCDLDGSQNGYQPSEAGRATVAE